MTEIRSPLKRKSSIISMKSSTEREKAKSRLEIDNLITKFNDINSQIEIEADQSNFNLIEYQREDQKIKYDPQMLTAKLRKLQNRAEIKRADMEMEVREKKKGKKSSQKEIKKDPNGYKTIYGQYLKNKALSYDVREFSDDESNDENQNNPKTVAFFSKLKNHPKVLEFTLNKIKMKNKEDEERQRRVLDMIEKQKQNKDVISPEYQQVLEEVQKSKELNKTYNPESVIESQGNKFYTKKSSENISKDILNLPRCNKMIEKQNRMLSQIEDKSLSKDNKKKLKSRLNEIIASIGKSEKISNKFVLPRIVIPQSNQNNK